MAERRLENDVVVVVVVGRLQWFRVWLCVFASVENVKNKEDIFSEGIPPHSAMRGGKTGAFLMWDLLASVCFFSSWLSCG